MQSGLGDLKQPLGGKGELASLKWHWKGILSSWGVDGSGIHLLTPSLIIIPLFHDKKMWAHPLKIGLPCHWKSFVLYCRVYHISAQQRENTAQR